MTHERVLISGWGTLSACGSNLDESLDSLAKGERHFTRTPRFDTTLSPPVFEVPDLPGEINRSAARITSLSYLN